ncbi:MAG: hypothetical protein J6O49_00540 [Bacteroidaceae bacterium]|nr:hypothetical protein [Bacteroidaceae bacterium]
MEALAAFLGRISNYNLLNNLIPGAILCVLLKYLVGYDLMNVGTLELLVIFYFVGMVNGRIGSIIVEPFLRWIKLVTFRDHKLFVEAEQKDKKIVYLSETNNMYRSMISVAFTAIVVKFYYVAVEKCWDFGDFTQWLILIGLLVLFALAYRKQTKYIVSRIDYHTSK